MATGKFKPCEDCSSAAACKKAGKCMASKKPMKGKNGAPAIAIMLALAPAKKKKK